MFFAPFKTEGYCLAQYKSFGKTVAYDSSLILEDVAQKAPILWLPDRKSRLIKKKPRCWERLKAGEEGDNRGQDGLMA